jgi:hypothetical protein
MSREALSREISQVVSRVVSGEEIDAAARGAMLASKYPDLGMSGEMISEAILRAANMVGMIKSAPMPAAWPDDPPRGDGSAPNGDKHAGGEGETPAVSSRSMQDDLAPAIGAEVGGLADDKPKDRRPSAPPPQRNDPIAALRRVFFRQ